MATTISIRLPTGQPLSQGMPCEHVPREGDLVVVGPDYGQKDAVGDYIVDFVRWHVGSGGVVRNVVVQLKKNG